MPSDSQARHVGAQADVFETWDQQKIAVGLGPVQRGIIVASLRFNPDTLPLEFVGELQLFLNYRSDVGIPETHKLHFLVPIRV
jgi:hypothetical protein